MQLQEQYEECPTLIFLYREKGSPLSKEAFLKQYIPHVTQSCPVLRLHQPE